MIAEVGINTCFEAMNSVDYAVSKQARTSVMAVHYDGDLGDDAAAGAKVAAEANRLAFIDVETTPGQANQAEAIGRVMSVKPGLVIITTNATDMVVIVGQTVARGFKGQFIGAASTWNSGVMKTPAAAAIKAQFLPVSAHRPFEAETLGHQAMRAALGPVDPDNARPAAWAWSYPLKAAAEYPRRWHIDGTSDAVQGCPELSPQWPLFCGDHSCALLGTAPIRLRVTEVRGVELLPS